MLIGCTDTPSECNSKCESLGYSECYFENTKVDDSLLKCNQQCEIRCRYAP